MKPVVTVAAQGEIYIRRIYGDPATFLDGGKPLQPENGKLVIGHSETGHHHVMEPGGVDVMVMDHAPEGIRLLRMIVQDPEKELVHERPHDTHETLSFAPGMYELRIGREYDPYEQVARQQMD